MPVKKRRKKKRIRFEAIVLMFAVAALAAMTLWLLLATPAAPPSGTTPATQPSSQPATQPQTSSQPATQPQTQPQTEPVTQPVTKPVLPDAYQASAGYQQDMRTQYEAYAQLYPELSIPTVVKYVNMGLDRPFYTNIVTVDDPDSLTVLVNKFRALPSNYKPSDLVVLKNKSRSGVQMRADAAAAFDRMSQAAAQEGLSILGFSGFRSYSYQNNLYSNYCKNDPVEVVDTYSARPGHSEHQTGLAIDVCTKDTAYNRFGTTQEYRWALEHMHEYGFIQSFPVTEIVPGSTPTVDNGQEQPVYLHGYMLEEWHFRYVGVELATYLHENGLLLDEYYALSYGKA